MAGRFKNTNYNTTIDSLVQSTKNKLNNPYYKFNEQSPTKCIYYRQSKENSTLDQSAEINYAHLGKDSPFKFNKINDFLLYGIERVQLEYDVGDYGLESAPITGDAIILPNTIIPYTGDFFTIPYIKEDLLFKVDSVTPDTLDTGAIIYKISYNMSITEAVEKIESQVVKEYDFLVDNLGTNFNTTILSTDIKLAEIVDGVVDGLIDFFNGIFFNEKLQTFIFNHDGWKMYDPYLIEFMRRNKVLSNGNNFVYVAHQTALEQTFSMDYNRTFFVSLENGDKERLSPWLFATADLITDPNSLFITRNDDYFSIRYHDDTTYKTRFNIFKPEVINAIDSNTYFNDENKLSIYNLWISYFNNDDSYINSSIIDKMMAFNYADNIDCFYALPINIFILKKYINKLMS